MSFQFPGCHCQVPTVVLAQPSTSISSIATPSGRLITMSNARSLTVLHIHGTYMRVIPSQPHRRLISTSVHPYSFHPSIHPQHRSIHSIESDQIRSDPILIPTHSRQHRNESNRKERTSLHTSCGDTTRYTIRGESSPPDPQHDTMRATR